MVSFVRQHVLNEHDYSSKTLLTKQSFLNLAVGPSLTASALDQRWQVGDRDVGLCIFIFPTLNSLGPFSYFSSLCMCVLEAGRMTFEKISLPFFREIVIPLSCSSVFLHFFPQLFYLFVCGRGKISFLYLISLNFYYYYYYLFLAVLKFEFRVSPCLACTLPLETCPQTFFALVIFQMGFCVFAEEGFRLHSSYLCLPRSLDYRHVLLCPTGWLRWGLTNFLAGYASIMCHPPDLHYLTSWDYRCAYLCCSFNSILSYASSFSSVLPKSLKMLNRILFFFSFFRCLNYFWLL
jgi:hypothetical protein